MRPDLEKLTTHFHRIWQNPDLVQWINALKIRAHTMNLTTEANSGGERV